MQASPSRSTSSSSTIVRGKRAALFFAVLSSLALGCSSKSDDKSGGSSGASSSGSGQSAGSGAPTGGGGPFETLIPANAQVGQIAPPTNTGLPSLPQLTNVVATERDDSVGIDFDPVDGAVDYRVYALPAAGTVTANADGSLTIPKTVYHCAGLRQTFDLQSNQSPDGGAGLYLENPPFNWKAQVSANPVLGYVYMTASSGLTPVYAVGGYPSGDELGWRESRIKVYTTDLTERQSLIAKGGRDDGIVFYVPAAASAATQTVYTSEVADMWAGQTWTHYTRYYFGAADMSARAGDTTPPAPAFQVLSATTTGAVPLYAIMYPVDDQQHVELAPGNERYNRALHQGNGPLWHLEATDINGPTTLVVEALSTGCPFQGFLSAQHLEATGYQTFYTLSDLQAASQSGEVYVNGQYDKVGAPVPVARSFVQVSPQPAASAWDWYRGFEDGTTLGTATEIPGCMEDGMAGYSCDHWTTPDWDISIYRIEQAPQGTFVFTYGTMLGQLWEAFDDVGEDVTGKVRFGALKTGTVSSDPSQFYHATMSVNMVSTDRRYPQLIISDQPPPVQEGMDNPQNNTLLIQPRLGPSMTIEVEAIHGLVNGNPWDVNNQAPEHELIPGSFEDSSGGANPMSPAEPAFEHAGVDRMTRFDAYVSSQRVYLFMDGTPAGCLTYPSGFTLSGSVSLTVGDVLYHEDAPDLVCYGPKPFSFLNAHSCPETERHFDDIGFKSNVPAPGWDETRLPCGPH